MQRRAEDRRGADEALLPAAGERAREAVAVRADVREVDCPFDALATLGAFQAINRAEELEVLHHGEVAIEREGLRDVADVRAHLLAVALDVEAVDGGVAAGRDEKAAEDADERRLAGAVRTEEAEDLAARDLQRDAVERTNGAEVLADVLDVNAD